MKNKFIPITILAIGIFGFSYNAVQAQNKTSLTIELKEYVVHQVQGKKYYTYKDKDNKRKESKTAYLVTLTFAQKLEPMDINIDYYIGDYKIPEYGGTENGIYFRLIEPGLLEKLNNQSFSYKVGNEERVPLKKKFVAPDVKRMKVETEESVLRQKQ